MSVRQKGHENKLAIPSRCSTGEKPRASGESFNVKMMSNPTDSAIIPGAHSPHFSARKISQEEKYKRQLERNPTFHPSVLAAVPASIGAANPPKLWAMFHMP